MRMAGFDVAGDVDPALFWHLDVHEDDIEVGVLCERLPALGAVLREVKIVMVLEDQVEGFPDAFFVVTNQDFLSWVHRFLLLT